jgi:hypothetical protein
LVWRYEDVAAGFRFSAVEGIAMSLRHSVCNARYVFLWLITGLSLIIGCGKTTVAQSPQQFFISKNYFVTGDYTVGGWVEDNSLYGTVAPGFATGAITIPDCKQYSAITGVSYSTCLQQPPPSPIPVGADIVAAYLYWGTVEGSQSSFVGQQAFFNGYKIIGTVLGNPNAPTSWSSGGCSGSSTGSKTMRFYRADVKPYLPLDLNPSSATYGSTLTSYGTGAHPAIQVAIADSGSNGNTQPNALGATLVLIWRVLHPTSQALNAIVLYDGSYAPSNQVPTFSETIFGFYQPSPNPVARITHIVANGQVNKGETVSFTSPNAGTTPLTSLYTSTLGMNAPPFPGIYGAWDNPTWDVSGNIKGGSVGSAFDTYETTSVTPASTNSGCVNWGAIVFSTTVQDTDNDGLLDVWEQNHGYPDLANTDKKSLTAPWVALPYPGSEPDPVHTSDIFVEGDYLTKLDGSLTQHSHLPKQAALDAVGQAFATRKINLHFDLGSGIYLNDPYVVQYIPINVPNPDPQDPAGTGITTVAPPPTAGGKAIAESALQCTDPAQPSPGSLCAFPTQPTVRWKGGFSFVQNSASLGSFQAGRAKSYRYALFGHALGDSRSSWSAVGKALAATQDPNSPQVFGILTTPRLESIVVASNVATVTIKTPTWIAPPNTATNPPTPAITSQIQPLILKPGDCANILYSLNPACADGNADRVTISGSLTPAAPPAPGSFTPGIDTATLKYPLNGTYRFSNVVSSTPDANGVVTTTFNVTTANVPDGPYDFSTDPELGITYLGPTSSSGEGDFDGGGDLAVTLGLWGADDNTSTCQPDPSQPLSAAKPVYCDNQVGTLKVQTGTIMHELGHTLTLTHGGTYYEDSANPSLATYDVNCKPNFLSVMSYLFQVRGFVDGGFDYSAQTLSPLNELSPPLSENTGLGVDEHGNSAQHETRWFSAPNSADNAFGDFAKGHCDGTPVTTYATQPPPGLSPAEKPAVRVDGTAPASDYSTPLDWDNDMIAGNDPVPAPGEDLNFNGKIGDQQFLGLNDWAMVDLRQTNARTDGFGFSGGGGITFVPGGGGITFVPGGGGITFVPGGGGITFVPGGGGITFVPGGGGVPEDDTVTANATVDPPSGLKCTTPLTVNGVTYPACTTMAGTNPSTYLEKSKGVPLTWTSPDFGQIRSYTVWRAVGSFPSTQQALQSIGQFTKLTPTLTGAPPSTSFVDTTVKASTTYTYFVTDSNFFQAKSTASTPIVVTVKF